MNNSEFWPFQFGPTQWRIQKSRKGGASLSSAQSAPENFGLLIIHKSHLCAFRCRKTHEQREIPLARSLTPSTNDDAYAVDQRRQWSTASLLALMIFTKECVNTIMNINILVAEKGGPGPLGPRPPGPHCWIRHCHLRIVSGHSFSVTVYWSSIL